MRVRTPTGMEARVGSLQIFMSCGYELRWKTIPVTPLECRLPALEHLIDTHHCALSFSEHYALQPKAGHRGLCLGHPRAFRLA